MKEEPWQESASTAAPPLAATAFATTTASIATTTTALTTTLIIDTMSSNEFRGTPRLDNGEKTELRWSAVCRPNWIRRG